MSKQKIRNIFVISDQVAASLYAIGITDSQELLVRGAERQGRQEIAQLIEYPEEQIHQWVKMADLLRINGIASRYAQLLQESGIQTASELCYKNPVHLAAKLSKVNEAIQLLGQAPGANVVDKWISQAQELPNMIDSDSNLR